MITSAARKAEVSAFPVLNCPICGVERAARSVNKDGSVTYSCPPDHAHHGNTYSWRIASDGTLIDL